jgi:hypothetical protein
VLTDASGNFTFGSLNAGTYLFRVVPQTNYTQTTPASNAGISVTLAAGATRSGLLFGERKIA